MPPKHEMKTGPAKPKSTKSEKEPFDAAEHKVIKMRNKQIITLNIQEFSKWVRQHEAEMTALEQSEQKLQINQEGTCFKKVQFSFFNVDLKPLS